MKLEDFWSYVDIRSLDECWAWQRGTTSGGYGSLVNPMTGRRTTAHRLAYELKHGPVSKELVVCHSCDNRICCNPHHLWVGTQADNIRDMVQKGRNLVGDAAGAHKLTLEGVKSIFALYEAGEGMAEIGRRVGIGEVQVGRILSGKQWKHIARPVMNRPIERKVLRGVDHAQSKLTDDKVRVIRKRITAGDAIRDIAADFHVSISAIRHVRSGRVWRHVK